MAYNKEINEALAALMDCCNKNGTAVVVALQAEGNNGVRVLSANDSEWRGGRIERIKSAAKYSDIDDFIRFIIKEAQEKGHRSLFLSAMGIPEEPFL